MSRTRIYNKEGLLFVILAAALILRIYFQSYSLGPATDGASYLEYARNIVQNGAFTSRIIDANPAITSMFFTGLTPHIGTPFGLAIFFEIGGVSYLSGKIMAIFFSLLLIFPVYKIAKALFSVEVGLIASVIMAFHPFLLEYSSMLYGPEIMGAFFVVSSMYFLMSTIQRPRVWSTIFAALFAFLTFVTWYPIFYVMLLAVPLFFILLDKRLHFKSSLIAFLVVGFWGLTFQFSANIPLGLLFHVGTLVVVVPMAFFKRRETWVRSLGIFLLALNVLLEVYWVRSYYFSEVFITPSSALTASSSVSAFLSNRVPIFNVSNVFTSLSSYLIPAYLQNVSPFLIFLSVMSFVILKDLRKKLVVLLFPFIQLFIYALSTPIDMLRNVSNLENRMLLSAVPFFAVLAALFISQLASLNINTRKIVLRLRKKSLHIGISALALILILSIIFFVQYYQQSESVINHIKSANINTLYGMDAAIVWINNNTSPGDVIATRKPYEWAWYTGRVTLIFNQSADFDGILGTIKEYRINYIIVDPIFYDYYSNLQVFYLHPENLPPFIQLVFSSQAPGGSKVLIYNTTELINSEFRYEAVPLNRFDDLAGLNTVYGKLSLDYESVKEGHASVELSSQPSPNWVNQSVAKIYEDIVPLDLSKAQSLSLGVKSDTNLQGNLFLQVFDTNDNWGLYYLPQTDVNQWQNITIPINSINAHSTTNPDLTNIQRIVLGVNERPKPFVVWFDQLSVVYLIESQSYIK